MVGGLGTAHCMFRMDAVDAGQSLIAELEDAIQSGSKDKRVETLRRVTDLFVADADRLSDQQIDVFDNVLGHLIKRIEGKALAELSRRLGPINNAPIDVVRRLARDDNIVVAEQILTTSARLSDTDLIEIASTKTPTHLMAISARPRSERPLRTFCWDVATVMFSADLPEIPAQAFPSAGSRPSCGTQNATSNSPRRLGFNWTSRYVYFGNCCCAPPRPCVRAFSHWPARKIAIKFSAFSRPSRKMLSTRPASKVSTITRTHTGGLSRCKPPARSMKQPSSSLRKAVAIRKSWQRFHRSAGRLCLSSKIFCRASIARQS